MIAVRLHKGKDKDIRAGFPWAYAGELIESSEWLLAEPGAPARIEDHKGQFVALGYINPKSQIACRVLTLKQEPIDEAFFAVRLKAAFDKRDAAIGVPYYRLVHSEADFLPGLTIDRFGDVLSIQVGTAGMEALQPLWMAALKQVLTPEAIVLRNDIPARKLEGLTQEVRVITLSPLGRGRGEGVSLNSETSPHPNLLPGGEKGYLIELHEYETLFLADLLRGQKTGWFYDQRDNRKMMADLANGKTLLDVYSHSGGFGIPAARAGAKVTLVDSSAPALAIAAKAAALNGVSCESICGDALQVMASLARDGKLYDIVCADPPPFIKSRKDIIAGMKGYAKVAAHAAALAEPGGHMFVASCSHHASRGAFTKAVMEGVRKAGRQATILRETGAAPDHPRHPMLPQSEYLKGILLHIA